MKRLKLLILLFCAALSIPLAYVIVHAYTRLGQEELGQLRYFSEALFDEIEQELARFVQREEKRTVDAYTYRYAPDRAGSQDPPLHQPPREAYILGYLQNNPDGSFQTPLVEDLGDIPAQRRGLIDVIKKDNAIFNRRKFTITKAPTAAEATPSTSGAEAEKKVKAGFADRYLSKSEPGKAKKYLGQKSLRKEAISVEQALNVAREDDDLLRSRAQRQAPAAAERAAPRATSPDVMAASPATSEDSAAAAGATDALADKPFEAEVAPMQSVHIRDGRYFIFRRVVINNQIYRQGLLLEAESFLKHLAAKHFDAQPMARFARLHLNVMENGAQNRAFSSGAEVTRVTFTANRIFPSPFDFLSASLQVGRMPHSPARQAFTIALVVLGGVMLLGLVAIYHSAHTVVRLSERRAQFVSSVTHELKTPLTNIRMYIEMLEQGVAPTPERERAYLSILGSESARLSRLINNVLELSKLENRKRHFDLRRGRIDTVFKEVSAIMAHKLAQEDFELRMNSASVPPFVFDREVMIQILINLVENSIKFGRGANRRTITLSAELDGQMACISVSDSGPGIPQRALKRVFDDFYRVDNKLTRSTGGTGIGLSLVQKFATAMGGTARAANNPSGGCTISICLPASPDLDRPEPSRP